MAEAAVPTITPTVPAGGPVDVRRPYFVGIGGLGMLPVARVCAERGYMVSGSDVRVSEGLEELVRCGVVVHTGHAAGQVPADATAVVFTHGVGEDHPEIAQARRRGIPLVHRSAVLNALMAADRAVVAVLGTHGRTSTSGMLAFSLARMGQEPSYVLGGDLDVPGSGGCAGRGGFFVAEVDESDRTHIGVRMGVAVITSIGHGHVENYAAAVDHVGAYERCVRTGLDVHGTLVLSADDPGCRELASRLAARGDGPRRVTFGLSSSADWRVSEAVSTGGSTTAVLHGPRGREFDLVLRVPGVHQLLNAAAAVATLHTLGQEGDLAVEALGCFDGVRRRMTLSGEAAGVLVFDSYAHHPDEVGVDLAAARCLVEAGGRVIVVFQSPGQARLDMFGDAFAKALAGCDRVVLTDSGQGVVAGALEALAARITGAGGSAGHVVPDRAQAVVSAADGARSGDVVILMGTGDIVESGPLLRAALAPAAA
ncbi:UDP-N-acetylmuramate--L-alanine ligase [Streptomyces sp. NBC_01451]|uniref:UDP-N-acetylmuramate--L-alanine ligase n=1 Tax=Streptomyces sp. NBC_01451 TaxID=2903872 RepID=UPI002E31D311|nr:Mur ligase domain-containing protein [Streptomyces sp. NBC_01451]